MTTWNEILLCDCFRRVFITFVCISSIFPLLSLTSTSSSPNEEISKTYINTSIDYWRKNNTKTVFNICRALMKFRSLSRQKKCMSKRIIDFTVSRSQKWLFIEFQRSSKSKTKWISLLYLSNSFSSSKRYILDTSPRVIRLKIYWF